MLRPCPNEMNANTMNGNILVGAKHFGYKSLILVYKLCTEMLRPCPNEMNANTGASQ
jgi:hypothetical protein